MQTKQFEHNGIKYIIENNNGLINVFEEGQDEAICCGFRETLNEEWNNSELAKTLYTEALTELK